MMEWLAESRYVGSDLHFAIHSNGSPNHDVNGIEIWVDSQTSPALSIASNIYDNLYLTYPYQSKQADRGVKFADGALGEVHPSNIKYGVLIELLSMMI